MSLKTAEVRHEIDRAFMEIFIRGMMKQAIRGVVEWKDREIEATRQVVGK